MKKTLYKMAAIVALVIAVAARRPMSAQDKDKQDKYALQIPGGLAFSEVRGYEQWQVVGPSLTEAANVIRAIVANPVMDQSLPGGSSRQWQAFPRRLQDCEVGVGTEKDNGSAFFGEHAGHSAWRPRAGRVHREGQQEVLRHARMGICDVRLRPRVRHLRPSHEGQQASGGSRRKVRRNVPRAGGVKGL